MPAPNAVPQPPVDARKIDAFSRLMNEKLDRGDAGDRKGYVRSIIDAVDVDDHAVRIIGSREILQAAIADKQIENGNVRSFVRKWYPGAGSNHRHCDFQSRSLRRLKLSLRRCT